MEKPTKEELDSITKTLADSGRLVEAGWLGLRYACVSLDAPEEEIRKLRKIFFAGAQHLFASIMSFLEPGEDPTDMDLSRMDKLYSELKEFVKDCKGNLN